MQLEGKITLVTGGATGIGRATALLFAEEGSAVVVADTNDVEATRTVAELTDNGHAAKFVRTDVSSAADVEALMKTIGQEYGGLDIIANVAGVQRAEYVTEASEENWDLIHNVNAKGCFLTAKYGVPLMRMREGGAIVNVASLAALSGGAGMTAYASSKGAVYSFTRALALELAPDIRVNCLCPGWTDTPFNNPAIGLYFGGDRELMDESVKANVPLERQSLPEEQAAALLFLASDASSYMTAQYLVVDGGMLN